MKKILYRSIVFCLVLTACKKDHKITEGGTQKVTFNVGFSQTMGEFKTAVVSNKLKINSADTSVTNYVNTIFYMVFKADGTLLHNIKQTTADAGFGSYTDNLAPGTYTVAIAAAKGLTISKEGNLDVQKISPSDAFSTGNFFFKKIQVTVASSDVNQSVSLSRAMSKLILKTNDVIPTGATYARLTISSASGVSTEFQLSTERGVADGRPQEVILFGGHVGKLGTPPLPNGVKLEMSYFFIYCTPLTVDIEVARADEHGAIDPLYGKKSILNVTGAPNSITTLSGNLFGGNGVIDDGFKIAIDTTWNTPINQGF